MSQIYRLAAVLVLCALTAGCGGSTASGGTTPAQQQSLQTLDQASRLGTRA